MSSFQFAAVAVTSPGTLTGTQIPDCYSLQYVKVHSNLLLAECSHRPAPTTGVLVLVLARAAPASECAICGPPGCWVQLTAARSNLAPIIFQLQSLEGGFCSGILHPLSQRPLALNSTPAFCRLRSFPGTTTFFGTTTTLITTSRSAPQEKHKRLHKTS